MSRRFFVQVFAVVALLVGGAFAFSACGESEEEQASTKVCDARGEFAEQVSAVVDDLGRSLSLSGAQSQLKAALADLQTAYRSSLAQVSCD